MDLRSPRVVVLAGAATLFVELALIRYVPGQVRVLGYFTNFVLLAAFLGFGVGMLAANRWPKVTWPSSVAPLALFAIIALTEIGTSLKVLPSTEHFLFVEYRHDGLRIPLYPFLALSFCALAASFVPLGHVVGRTLVGDRPLFRYGLNLVGSLAGIALFAALAASTAPPWLWMCLAASATTVGVIEGSNRWRVAAAIAIVATALLAARATSGAVWSPYQKITTGPVHLDPAGGVVPENRLPHLTDEQRSRIEVLGSESGFVVRVNDDSYQKPIDLRPAAVAARPALKPMQIQYDLPFTLKSPPGEVLVLGAGTGNDVAAALRAGATRVDAVEIDPEIVRLGYQHPEKPYADKRVSVHVADARSFLARSERHYDAIVYGLLDSHVLLSSRSNVRLDSFVFTRESFSLARKRLAPDGVLFVSHAVGRPWFVERMSATLEAAFEAPPAIVTGKVFHPIGVIYAAGPNIQPGAPARPSAGVIEDDWPFVYLQDRSIPKDYLFAMAIMALVALFSVRLVSGRRWHDVDLHFFALGAGFLLLETRGLAVLALHIGSTWGVNAAVFGGVLVMALGATIVGARLGNARWLGPAAWTALAVCLLVNILLPVGALSGVAATPRVLLGVLLVSSPLFASGLIFALSLRRSGAADRALASNLIGAMVGGLLEYTAMITGFHYLVVIAAAFYGLALVTHLRRR